MVIYELAAAARAARYIQHGAELVRRRSRRRAAGVEATAVWSVWASRACTRARRRGRDGRTARGGSAATGAVAGSASRDGGGSGAAVWRERRASLLDLI